MTTVKSEWDSKHLSTSDYHSSEHNPMLLAVVTFIIVGDYVLKNENVKSGWAWGVWVVYDCISLRNTLLLLCSSCSVNKIAS